MKSFCWLKINELTKCTFIPLMYNVFTITHAIYLYDCASIHFYINIASLSVVTISL